MHLVECNQIAEPREVDADQPPAVHDYKSRRAPDPFCNAIQSESALHSVFPRVNVEDIMPLQYPLRRFSLPPFLLLQGRNIFNSPPEFTGIYPDILIL